jgi:RND family efflux transporter MFP subunit
MKKISFVSTLLSGILFFACTQNAEKKEIPRSVKIETVKIYDATPASVFPGKIKAGADASLSFKVAGRITKIHAGEGDSFKKGQILAEMDDRDYRLQLSATEAEYHSIKAEAGRIIELHRLGSVTPNDYDKAVYGLQQISAKYEAHKNALADAKLAAPFDGYVQQQFYSAGELVAAGTPIFSALEATLPEVEINIPPSEFIKREEFAGFTCTLDIYPGKIYTLALRGIAQKANLNQLYAVRLKMKKEESPLPAPGMTTMVTIQYKPGKSALYAIPYTAIFERNSAAHVWIYDSGSQTVSAREVKISKLLNNGTVTVSEGVQAGELVVAAGVHSLKENEKVKILPSVSSTNTGKLL